MQRRATIAREGGFTLIEMMVVVALIALLMGMSTMSFRSLTKADLRSSAGKTAAAMRFAFDRGLMTGAYLRLAIDLDKGRLWLEASKDRVSLRSGKKQYAKGEDDKDEAEGEPGEEHPAARKHAKNPMMPFGAGEDGEDGDEGAFGVDAEALVKAYETANEPPKRPKPRFTRFRGPGVKEIRLKGSILVEAVKTARMEEPVEKGMAYIYFFPQGHAEPAIVRLMNKSEDYYSVVLHPLTGSARIYPCKYRIPDEFGQDDDEGLQKKKRRRDACEGPAS
ncbi:MAG: prepilin-type N-terminal cleavage/methylation domain-containing protein [Deltaproteobacteria bacterium]|nr:prepilin-type N-terminal cleavage/methylation domain-containing protein [Deltaproteobacteria bacterium]